ncbi:MAG: hypothetical protein RL563_1101 [Pseudomonadota bacterium]|jgi:hypothetical protein
MYVLIRSDNIVAVSQETPINAVASIDVYDCEFGLIYDPRPSSGIVPIQMDFPEKSFSEYQIIDGVPVRIMPKSIKVPHAISPRQIRLALTSEGLRDVVESAIADGSQELKDWWEFSLSYERNHPLILSVANQLGVSPEKLDKLWIKGFEL